MSAIGGSTPIQPPAGATTAPATSTPTPAPSAPAAPITVEPAGPFASGFAEVAAGTATIEIGAQGAFMKPLETALESLGYKLPGLANPDEKFTRATQNMIARFQRDNGLPQTGALDQATLSALDTAAKAAGLDATGAVSTGPPDPLAGQLFMDKSTFEGMSSGGWARDNVELEKAMSVTGVDAKDLVEMLRAERRPGQTNFQRLRKSPLSEAFTVGYGVDEMPWDSRSHRAREDNPYVWLTVESGRFEQDEETGERELSLGTDIMDDIYFDTDEYTLLDNGASVRARIRWDNPEEVRRLLVAAKFGSEINDVGIKSAAKVDVRNDRPDKSAIDGLADAVMRGHDSWNDNPATPLKAVYDKMAEAGVLKDVGPHEGVLALKPQAYLRSTRSRFHMNEASRSHIGNLMTNGQTRMQGVADLLAARIADGAITGNDADDATELQAKITGALDGSLIAERAAEALKAIDPAFDPTADAVKELMPGARSATVPDFKTLELRRVVSETIDAVYHEIGDDVDDLHRVITGAPRDNDLEDHVGMFVAWQKSTDTRNLGKLTTYDRFADIHSKLVAGDPADKEKALEAYNAHGEAQKAANNDDFEDFEPLDLAKFEELGTQIQDLQVEQWALHIEAAGSAATGLWFDDAREHYVPSSSRSTGNFLIDTMDYVEMIKPEDWNAIPEAERKADVPIPADKVFHASLVNEVQIELGREEPYVERIRDLKGQIDVDRSSLLMKWADSVSHPALGGGSDDAAYQKLLGDLQGMDDAALVGTAQSLNDFLTAQGSGLEAVTVEDLRGLKAEGMTVATRDRDVRKESTLEQSLSGAEMVFSRYTDSLEQMAELKERRVTRTLDRAGADNSMDWEGVEMSKGDLALTTLRNGG